MYGFHRKSAEDYWKTFKVKVPISTPITVGIAMPKILDNADAAC